MGPLPRGRQQWLGPGKLSPEDSQWSEGRQKEWGPFPRVLANASPSQKTPEEEPHVPGVARGGVGSSSCLGVSGGKLLWN